jgi:predicted S18 family serine protease
VAGVDLNAPDVRVPDTSDYEPYLGADVRGQVFAVTDANAAAYARLRTLALRASDENQVESVLAEANASVQAAQEFIDADKFYAAATSAFRARVSTRLASMLMDLYQAAKTTGVRDVVDACSSAARQAANEAGNLTAADIVAWYAVGEAQQRAKEAEDLARQAASSMRTAYRLDDWIQVLQEASLCMERAQSSHWWAGMPRVFPAGPAIPDPKAFAQDILSEAEEAILYGQAVGATGGQAKWQEAMRFVERQWWPAATRMGIQAMTESAVDLQSQAGDVPGSVLQAARQAAAQAVARARASGVEPLVSVSLMELAEEQDAKEELGSYWTARSLALMGPVRDRTVSTPPAPVAQPTEWPVWVAFAALVLSGLVAYRGVRRS